MVGNRSEYLGVHITKKLKRDLINEAKERGILLSPHVSWLLENRNENRDLLKDLQRFLQIMYEYSENQEDVEDLLNRIRLRIN